MLCFRIFLDVGAATRIRDSLSKYIYFILRYYIITRINDEIESGKPTNYIGILDMPGFGNLIWIFNWFPDLMKFPLFLLECFERNSLEQLFINYSNERVQKFCTENLIDNYSYDESSVIGMHIFLL